MKIVILDGYTLNPGDLSWEPIQQLGELVVYDRTPPEQVVQRAAEAEIVLTNKAIVSRSAIEQLPRLRYIGVLATGYNIVDIDAARDRGILVTNVPAYATQSVAQAVFAHLLNLAHHTAEHAQGVRAGRWSDCPDFCYWDWPLVDLAGLTMGIIGFGRIGQAVARIAQAFQMQVLAYDANPELKNSLSSGVEWAELDDLFGRSDVVSLHCPLTRQNERLVNAQRLALMKPTALLINTSRGALIDEVALAEALNRGQIAGAGLDVLSVEPPPADHPLLSARNCYITPHQAWATKAARQRLLQTAADNIRAFLAGQPQNVVNM